MLGQPGAFDGFQHLVLLMDHTMHHWVLRTQTCWFSQVTSMASSIC